MRECDRLRERLSEYAVGRLRGRGRARVADHVRVCDECRRELAALERTGSMLDAVGLEEAPVRTRDGVRQSILARKRVRPRARLRWAWGMAVGVVVLALVGFGVTLMGPRRVEMPPMVVAVQGDEEMEATMQGHLSAVWAAPLADEAAVGLRLGPLEDDG